MNVSLEIVLIWIGTNISALISVCISCVSKQKYRTLLYVPYVIEMTGTGIIWLQIAANLHSEQESGFTSRITDLILPSIMFFTSMWLTYSLPSCMIFDADRLSYETNRYRNGGCSGSRYIILNPSSSQNIRNDREVTPQEIEMEHVTVEDKTL